MGLFQRLETPTPVLLLADLAAVAAASCLALFARELTGGYVDWPQYAALSPRLAIFPLLYAAGGLYPGTFLRRYEELKKLSMATSAGFMVMALTFFLTKEGQSFSRVALVMAWAAALFLVPLTRSLLRARCAAKQQWVSQLAVFGRGSSLTALLAALQKNARSGMAPVALVLPPGASTPDQSLLPEPIEIIRAAPLQEDTRKTLRALTKRHPNIHALLVLSGYSQREQEEWLNVTEQCFSRILLIPDALPGERSWDMAAYIGSVPGLMLRQNLLDKRRLRMKRVLDITLTICGCTVLLPLLLLLALLVRLDSRGPALFSHERIGRNGKRFMAYKFRTMAVNAAELLEKHLAANPELRREWEETQKLKDDPRITRMGHFLRKSSLDELPQLLNVLKGEMSLVGPRPIVENEIAKYGEAYELYTQVRPGITGLWQISGRSDTTYAERIHFDRYYISNWSVWLDIHIIFRTIPEVLGGKGAY